MKITLPARPSDPLHWQKQIKEAAQGVAKGESLLWELDLGIHLPYFPLEDELYFQALSLGLTQFTQEIWPCFGTSTVGAILYRGSADFSALFRETANYETNWTAWKANFSLRDEAHLKRLFCAEAFVAYFRMLSAKLPDELPLILHLENAYLGTLAQKYHLLAPERFEHFSVEMGHPPPLSISTTPRLGICLPPDPCITDNLLEQIDSLLQEISLPYKVISESLLLEQWGELDYLYIFSSAKHSAIERQLRGFCAAGGIVITEGELLGLPQEISAEKWNRGRGI